MAQRFRLVTTPGYERDVRALTKRNQTLLTLIERLYDALEQDPHNVSGRYNIKKLAGVRPGQGVWRIRSRSYRLRYDVIGNEVLLYSMRDRKEAY